MNRLLKYSLPILLLHLVVVFSKGATFVVDNNADTDNLAVYTLGDGTNSLRKCIRLANTTAGADIINFNIPGAGPFTINLVGDLPAITQQVEIRGLTQGGAAAGTLMIEINGTAAGNSIIFDNGSAGSILEGVCVNRSNRGLYIINTSNITLLANYIGTDITGMIARPCNWNGIQIDNSTGVTIGGIAGVASRNIISGNAEVGIRVDNSQTTYIYGNYIGVNATGNAALANNWNGIQFIGGCHNSIIGTTLGRNIISGNGNNGVLINTSNNLLMIDNIVGLGADGNTVVSNAYNGISINNSNTISIGGQNIVSGNLQVGVRLTNCPDATLVGTYIGTDITTSLDRGNNENGLAVYSSNNLIVHQNVISGNNQNGVYIENSLAARLSGNRIGVDLTSNTIIPNNQNGVLLTANSNGAQIGNTANGGNVISGNLNSGVFVTQSTNVTIRSNMIGTNLLGSLDLGNAQTGVSINNNSTSVFIGGSALGEGNHISGNNQQGVYINNSASPTLRQNVIGLNFGSNAAIPNNYAGVFIINSDNPIIGGTGGNDRNIISGNLESGIIIISSASPLILGNFIGVDGTTTTDLGNGQQGISLENLDGAIIGNGLVTGVNIISGNNYNGIFTNAATNTVIRGNIIGSDAFGTLDIGNSESGINMNGVSTDPIIGGGTLGQGNLISGNGQNGIVINNSLRPNIKGNIIGLASDGNTILSNGQAGIALFNGCNNPIIGGNIGSEGNIVSGNLQIGIHVNASIAPSIMGNYIGVDALGTVDRGNGESGILINNGSTNAAIGSPAAFGLNIISGNNQTGLFVLNSANPAIFSNIIGLGLDGTTAIGNNQGGITIENSNNPIIGGSTIVYRNLVSSNGESGIMINNSINAIIKANFVGVDASGMLPRGNGQAGIRIINNSNNAIVGGPSVTEGNITSNNGWAGILINNSTDVAIKSCIIGLASDYTTAAPNLQGGIGAYTACHRLIVGGVLVAERNYISSNTGNGITVTGSNDITLVNNYVGVELTGLVARPNTGNGVNLEQCDRATVGGPTATARNILSANGANGLRIVDHSDDAIITANYMGVGSDGTTPLGNTDNGIFIADSSNQAIVGGSLAVEKNVLSGNGTSGVGDGFRTEASSRHLILGNYCGVDATGTVIIGNAWAGISLNESRNCIVGGPGANEGNICSGNLNEGVYFRNAEYSTFIGNYVGTDKTGTLQLGNEDWGINIRAVSIHNVIGGTAANFNTIAYNRNIAGLGTGVFVEGNSQFNTITYNKIYCNAGLGIDLIGTANESIVKPTLLTSLANQITGTGSVDGDIIHVYQNNTTGTGCDCEGEVFIGTAVVTGGTWSLTHGLGLSAAATGTLTATETTTGGSTSEFADCLVPLPVSILIFTAKKLNDHAAILEWKTTFEQNNDYFIVERSADGINFESIGTVKGAGNSSSLLSYSFIDENPEIGLNYYRIKQVDFDGRSERTSIRIVNFGDSKLALGSAGDSYFIISNFDKATNIEYEIYSTEGKLVRSEKYSTVTDKKEIVLTGLSSALYYIKISGGENTIADKLLVK